MRARQVSLSLGLDLDAVAVVIPAGLAARVAQILDERRCPPAMLTHPALLTHRVVVAGSVTAALNTALREPPPSPAGF